MWEVIQSVIWGLTENNLMVLEAHRIRKGGRPKQQPEPPHHPACSASPRMLLVGREVSRRALAQTGRLPGQVLCSFPTALYSPLDP